jgi:hypothetical protein
MSTDPIRFALEKRAKGTMISYAILRWESAAIIGLTILLAAFYPDPFPWWRWYYWAGLGVLAEALIVFTSVTDERTAQEVVAEMFREAHNPREIGTPAYRQSYERALDYQQRIKKAIEDVKSGSLRDRLERVDRAVSDWLSQIFELARRLDRFERNEVIAKDIQLVPLELKNLETKHRLEDNVRVREELTTAVDRKRAQLSNLQELENTMESAHVRLDATLTALATAYSQVLLLVAKGEEGASADGVASSIAEQISSLQDVIETMDEVLRFQQPR